MDDRHKTAATVGDEEGAMTRDPGAAELRSLRDAIDDGFSVGHADAMMVETRTHARVDEAASNQAETAAVSRGVPHRYRMEWCEAYARGAATAHGKSTSPGKGDDR